MNYRLLGKTDLRISAIGIGGNLFGYSCDQSNTKLVIQYAENSGVNFIDTADVYSEGKSEEFIGKAIQGRRKSWILASKIGLKSHSSPEGLGKKENIILRLEGTLKRLQTDYLDLYQIHHFDNSTPLDETFEAFDQLIKSGKILYAGCSNFNGNQIKMIDQWSRGKSKVRFESIQAYYNLLKRDLELSILPYCKKSKVGVLIYGALGRGVLTSKYITGNKEDRNSRVIKNPTIRKDFIAPILRLLKELSAYARDQKWVDVSQLVIAWALSQEGVTAVILGSRTLDQLKSNLQAADIQLNKNQILTIDRLVGDLDQYNEASLGHPGKVFLH